MKILGQFDTLVESVHAFEVIKCHVVEGKCYSLLSYQSAKSLHIIDTINATACNLKDSHVHLFRGIINKYHNFIKTLIVIVHTT